VRRTWGQPPRLAAAIGRNRQTVSGAVKAGRRDHRRARSVYRLAPRRRSIGHPLWPGRRQHGWRAALTWHGRSVAAYEKHEPSAVVRDRGSPRPNTVLGSRLRTTAHPRSQLSLALTVQVGKNREHAPVRLRCRRQAELVKDACDVLLDGALGHHDPLADRDI
jgi:hypothetical protein